MPWKFCPLVTLSAMLMLNAVIYAQGLSPEQIASPGADTWPTYNGDYTGRRFSPLDQINRSNAADLTMAWAFQLNGPKQYDSKIDSAGCRRNRVLCCFPIMCGPSMHARDGRSGTTSIRQMKGRVSDNAGGLYKDLLYFETPDAHLICLTAQDGQVKWNIELADVRKGYWASMAPLVIRDHVIVGVSGDEDNLPGFLRPVDPLTRASAMGMEQYSEAR